MYCSSGSGSATLVFRLNIFPVIAILRSKRLRWPKKHGLRHQMASLSPPYADSVDGALRRFSVSVLFCAKDQFTVKAGRCQYSVLSRPGHVLVDIYRYTSNSLTVFRIRIRKFLKHIEKKGKYSTVPNGTVPTYAKVQYLHRF
jgi:hypothetical protein